MVSEVEPKRQELAAANAKLEEANVTLTEVQAKVAELNAKVQELEAQFKVRRRPAWGACACACAYLEWGARCEGGDVQVLR